ncbi:MAG TPA: M14 family zinc carboxypeptidase, partial [Thermoanaerobaculia bacterium]|nr:M14 family zinc carboxypeptidase [Thermoanaerobaculia bacterium]
MIRRIALPFALALVASFALGQVPTPDEFLGYPLGERFTPHHRILEYFDELARRSPLITIEKFGETYEGRPLVLATITSAKNRAALDSIRANVAALARGESPDLAKSTPAIVWLAFGVHGNESSSAEAAMLVASTLLRDADSSRLLDDAVVLIDPLQNPDGRERYISWFHRTRGVKANPNPDGFEHREPWPGGRTNHYLIDMNRDWA